MDHSLTLPELKGVLDYNPISGDFTWKDRPSIKTNKIYFGKIAGSSVKGLYWRININGKSYKAHRLAWFYVTGNWPVSEIDHRDTNGFNNSWGNLREATQAQNKWNMKIPITNKSGYKGVFKRKDGRWLATIQRYKGKSSYIGAFDDIEDAIKARHDAAEIMHGEFRRDV